MPWDKNLKTTLVREFGGLGSIFRSTAMLSIMQVVAKGVSFVSLPILSRLYAPSDFGFYTAYLAVVSILIMFGNIRLEFIIPMVATKRMASYILSLSIIFTVLSAILISIFSIIISNIFNLDASYILVILISVSSVFMIWFNTISTYFIRLKDYTPLGTSQILRYIVQGFSQLALGFLGFFQFGLIVGDVVGRAFSVAVLAPRTMMEVRPKYYRQFRFMIGVAKPFLRHCLTHTVTSVIHTLPTMLLPIFILKTYSSADAGYFSFSYQIVLAVAQIVMLSLAKVYVGEISEAIRRDPSGVRRITNKIILLLSAIVIIPSVVVWILSPQLYVIFFGKEWLVSSFYFRIMLPAIIVQLIIGPVFNLIILLKQAHRQLRCDLAMFFAVVLLMGVATRGAIGLNGLLIGFSATITIGYLWLLAELYASITVFERNNQSSYGPGTNHDV